MCTLARRRGVVSVVDGAHAPAMLPLALDAIGADFYGGNCHKWLLAPTGTGFLHFTTGNEDRLQPLQVSWGWHHDRSRPDERDEFGSTPRLRALEFEGTRDPCPWLAVPTAIDFQAALGPEAIRARIAELAGTSGNAWARAGTHARHARPPALCGALTAFRIPDAWRPEALRATSGRRIASRLPSSNVPIATSSASTHFYNTTDEVDRLGALETFS